MFPNEHGIPRPSRFLRTPAAARVTLGSKPESKVPMSPTFRSFAEPDEQAANRQSTSLAALAVTLALVVASLYLVQQLRAHAAYEDCVLSGRAGCVCPT